MSVIELGVAGDLAFTCKTVIIKTNENILFVDDFNLDELAFHSSCLMSNTASH